MEVLSLLKFWRNAVREPTVGESLRSCNGIRSQGLETEEETTDDEDSFFDLVFTAPDCDPKKGTNCSSTATCFNNDDEDHYKLFSKLDGQIKSNFIESPIDVFYKRGRLPIESNQKPQSPISLLRSAPKFRVFMLRFTKSKSDKTRMSYASMEEVQVPISSLLARDNSLRSKLKTESLESASIEEPSKRFSKDGVQKYLNLIKPLYVKASKRYSERLKFSDQSPAVTPFSTPAKTSVFLPRKQAEEKLGSRAAVFREVCKNLGKSRSASSAVRMIPSPAGRSDDSVLLQQDGIQSAILHCKRSYNSLSQDCSVSREINQSTSKFHQGGEKE